jgi:hypothetical protein
MGGVEQHALSRGRRARRAQYAGNFVREHDGKLLHAIPVHVHGVLEKLGMLQHIEQVLVRQDHIGPGRRGKRTKMILVRDAR